MTRRTSAGRPGRALATAPQLPAVQFEHQPELRVAALRTERFSASEGRSPPNTRKKPAGGGLWEFGCLVQIAPHQAHLRGG